MGDVDASAKSVAPRLSCSGSRRAKQMAQMEADYGKTWLMGKVTAIDGVQSDADGRPDNAAHSFVADENTTFRKRRDPITSRRYPAGRHGARGWGREGRRLYRDFSQ